MAKGNEVVYSTLTNTYQITANDLIDRVINVKFTMQKYADNNDPAGYIEDVFVIRSDYEIYFPTESMYSVRKCSIKPSIKVQYKQMSSGTAIAIDLFLSNFFIMTKDGKTLMSINQQTYDIAKVEIQMGYLGQFNKLLGLDNKAVSDLDYKDLFDFTKEGAGVQTITINDVERVTTDKLVPDYTLHVHGYVGNTVNTCDAVPEEVAYSNIPESSYFKKADDEPIPELFNKYVTRRFLNTNIFPKGQKIPKYEKDGFFSEEIAKNYGVAVVFSSKARKLALNSVKGADGKEVTVETYMSLGGSSNTVDSTIQKLTEYCSKPLTYRRLNSGVILVFCYDELRESNIASLFEDIKDYIDKDTQLLQNFNNKLPCVNNINIDAVATIVCPFFTWINPFQYFYFETRYALTSLVSFYANFNPSMYKFYAINCTVSFATTEDVNEMQIVAVADVSARLGEGGDTK